MRPNDKWMKFSRNILLNYSVQLAPSLRNAPIKLRNLKRKPLKILCPKFRKKLYVMQNLKKIELHLSSGTV